MLSKLSHALRPRRSKADLRGDDAPERPPSPLEFSCAGPREDSLPCPNLGLEALALEPIIGRSLRPMAPLVTTRQQVLVGPGPSRKNSLAESMLEALDRQPSQHLQDNTGGSSYGLLSSPLPGLGTPDEEREDPFNTLDNPLLRITPLPNRGSRQRKTVSLRGRRELPLRVQAIRRSHQQAFAEALAQKLLEQAEEDQRRASASAAVERRPSLLLGRRPRAASAWGELTGSSQPYISLTWHERAGGGRIAEDLLPDLMFTPNYSLGSNSPSPPGRRASPPQAYVAPDDTSSSSSSSGDDEGPEDGPGVGYIPIAIARRRGTPF